MVNFIKVLCKISHSFNKCVYSRHPLASRFRFFCTYSTMAAQGFPSAIGQRYDDIIRSEEDKRLYRGLELTNGMKILLVSDPSTDKSAASMGVNIGHMSDPEDLPGLAHFCEHMLFLGTVKYPTENEYCQFLSQHGGSSNAFTSGEMTNYFFDVSPDSLAGALDRFAQFFLCPLFTESATDREINAVNSEHDKNLPTDAWRMNQLDKSTCIPTHPYSKFGSGNRQTLDIVPKENGVVVREELLKFHSKYYSANIMGLTILGRESLDELTDMAVNLFSSVANKNVTIPEWVEHPYSSEQLGKKIYAVPIKDIRGLNITWPIPDLREHYKSCPTHYLGHLIGHEGKGSLLSELKKKGWVSSLVGGEKTGARGFGFFICNVDLTEQGMEHIDDIITLIYQYLNMLRKEGVQEWVHEECRDLSLMTFRFKDKEKPRGYVSMLSQGLFLYPLTESLSAPYQLTDYRPDLISMLVDKLTPDNMRVGVVAKQFVDIADQKEHWYGTEYKVEEIPKDLIQKWSDAGLNDNLSLPERNEFIATDFEIVLREDDCNELPQVLEDTPMSRLWFKQDNTFLLPKACLSFDLSSPIAYQDPVHANLTYMFTQCFNDALNEYSYMAELAGLKYDLFNTMYGLSLSIKGYSDKQHILLQKIMDKLTSFKVDAGRFEINKENYVRRLQNFRAEQPHQHAIYYCSLLVTEHAWTKAELLDVMDEVTIEALEDFIPRLLSKIHIDSLIYGNMTKQRALYMNTIVVKALQEKMNSKPLLPSQQKKMREVQLPDGCSYCYQCSNDVHTSTSLEIYYQCNMQETRNNMLLELFCQVIQEPCFDTLRTKEQLGYIVFSGIRRSSGVQGLRVIVQSDRSPEYVESRVEAFLHSAQEMLTDMDEAMFNKHVTALATKRSEKPKKLSSQNAKYWTEIVSEQYNFNRDEIEVNYLATITKEDLIQFYKELIAYNAPCRHKVAVHVVSGVPSGVDSVQDREDCTDGLIPAPSYCQSTKVEDISEFKKQLGLFPLPKPFITVGSAKSKL